MRRPNLIHPRYLASFLLAFHLLLPGHKCSPQSCGVLQKTVGFFFWLHASQQVSGLGTTNTARICLFSCSLRATANKSVHSDLFSVFFGCFRRLEPKFSARGSGRVHFHGRWRSKLLRGRGGRKFSGRAAPLGRYFFVFRRVVRNGRGSGPLVKCLVGGAYP